MDLRVAVSEPPRIGRPPKPPDERLSEVLSFRVTPKDYDAAYRYAMKRGVPDSALLSEEHGRTTTESLRAVADLADREGMERVILVSRVIRGIPMHDSTQIPLRERLLSTAQSLPDVEVAAWVSSAPFVSTSSTAIFVQGIDSTGRLGTFTYQAASPTISA